MKDDIILPQDNLDNIYTRMLACIGLLHFIHAYLPPSMGDVNEAIYAACDCLDCIARDFRADIDGAPDYTGDTT